MSLPFPPPPPPPPKPPSNSHTHFPDFLLTALSLFALFASPKHLPLPLPSKSLSPTNPRRLLLLRPTPSTTTTMSRNPNLPSSHPFPTPQSLSDWLRPRIHPDSLSAWGTHPGTKNIHNLWLELSHGETSLIDTTPPLRNLHVLSLRIIGPHGRVLVESHQELSDGSLRPRNRPLAEKLKAGEDPESAVKRAVMEELGSILCRRGGESVDLDKIVKVLPDTYEKRVEQRDSVSYPGLPGCYVVHTLDVVVDGLPDEEFATEEGDEYGDSPVINRNVAMEAVSVKRHFWKWVARDSL